QSSPAEEQVTPHIDREYPVPPRHRERLESASCDADVHDETVKPAERLHAASKHRVDAVRVRDVRRDRHRLSVVGRDPSAYAFRGLRTHIETGQLRAFAREKFGYGPAVSDGRIRQRAVPLSRADHENLPAYEAGAPDRSSCAFRKQQP